MRVYNIHTCRYCHRFGDSLVQYGARHWAHWDCILERLETDEARREWLNHQPTWRLNRAPFMLLQDYGLLDFVKKLVAREGGAR